MPGLASISQVKRASIAWAVPLTVLAIVSIYFLNFSEESRFSFPLDDAWIHRVYSRSFATGDGFAYNPGVQEAGETSPLWAIATAPVHWFGGSDAQRVALWVKAFGVLMGFVLLMAVVWLCSLMGSSLLVSALTGILLALDGRLVFSLLSGMENGLLIALWVLALCCIASDRWRAALILCGLLPVTRPEAAMILPVVAIGLLLRRRKLGLSVTATSLRLSVLLLPILCWSLFCLSVNGHPLPNTFYAKAHKTEFSIEALAMLKTIVAGQGLGHLLLFWPICLAGALWIIWRRTYVSLCVFIGLYALPVVYGFGVVSGREMTDTGYYWTRWIDPVSVLLTVAVCFCVATSFGIVWKFREREQRPSRMFMTLVSAFVCVWFFVESPKLVESFEERRVRFASDSSNINAINVAAALWLKENTPPSAVVGVQDAGALRYFSDRRIIDVLGLNTHERTFKTRSMDELVNEMDFLAVYPVLLNSSKYVSTFERITSFKVAPEDYTICPCPFQLELNIYRKNSLEQH